MQTANFTTGGMRREGCAHTIRNTLERMDGVKPNSVSRESRAAGASAALATDTFTRDWHGRVLTP